MAPEPAPRSRFDPLCALAAFGVPLLATAARVAAAPQWRDDLPVVRSLGFVPIGAEGALSSVLVQAAILLPLGGRLLRASLVSALGLAAASVCLYFLARRILDAHADTPRFTPLLALAASLLATLAPIWQLEGTVAGGATIGAAMALLTLLVRRVATKNGDARTWLGCGALLALTAVESHAAGVALLAAVIAESALRGDVPSRRAAVCLVGGAAVVGSVLLIPAILRPLSPRAWIDLGLDLDDRSLGVLDTAAARGTALGAWLLDVGVVAVTLAALGAAWGATRARLRPLVAPLAVFVVADMLMPATRGGVLSTDSLAPLRLLAVGSLALFSTLGLHAAALALRRVNQPLARATAALLVVFDFALVVVASDDSSFVADQRSKRGADVWTDEALAGLPRDSLVLVRSQATAWRLWAARVVRGERPDLVVVPVPLLDRGTVAARLLALEPALAPLIREVAVTGAPNEFALSSLADARPLFVELDPAWDPRLVDHVTPAPLWLGFAPHALGRSDRTEGLARSRAAFERAFVAASDPANRDHATLAVLGARAREQAYALAALGDRSNATLVLTDLRAIDPADPFAAELEARLAKRMRGRVSVVGLLSN